MLEARQVMASLLTSAENIVNLQPQFSGGTPNDLSAAYEGRLERAFQRVSDLSQYTPQQLVETGQWVLHLGEGGSFEALAAALGGPNLAAIDLIPNTYLYSLPSGTNRDGIGPNIQATPGVEYAYPLVAHEVNKRFVPNDPLYGSQWHLNNTGQTGGTAGEDARLETAWDVSRGTGVVIAVVDDGVQHTHPDLSGHYAGNLSIDLVDGDLDPAPDTSFDFHGTAVAGVATANTNNSLGVAGAAPDARFAGIRLLGPNMNDLTEAQAITFQNQNIQVYNNSWGPPDGYGGFDAPGPLMIAALEGTAVGGRNGLGTLQMWAAGNGGLDDDNSNYDGYANSWFTTAIGAIDHTGRRAGYSEPGANMLVTTYSLGAFDVTPGITTTDLVGGNGYNDSPGDTIDDDPLADLDYTSTFSGTSSSTPLASGIVALMLSANPNLTWRDVNQILLQTARQNDPTDPGWSTNGAGYHVNHNYGFGSIDAAAAVNLARTWTNLAAPTAFVSGSIAASGAIPDGTGEVQFTITVTEDILIEQVELVVDISHAFPEDLEITLESPDGTESILAQEHFAFDDTTDQLVGWSFNSVRHWGELAKGDWLLTVRDKASFGAGTVNSLEINFLGTPATTTTTPGRISGTVIEDLNGNGAFEANETFLAGATVFLDTNTNGVFDAGEPSRITNTNGRYTFTNLAAGNYTVDIVVDPLSTQTFPAAPGNYSVTLAANQTVTDNNFAIQPAPIGIGPYTLTNGTGDNSVTVGVDGFGSFGTAVGSDADDAFFNPPGPLLSDSTTFESGVAIGIGAGERTFLSTGIDSFLNNPQVTGTSTAGSSDFVYNNLLFHLDQTLVPLNDASGRRVGSQLVQSYTITNIGNQAQSFDLVRYFDGDLDYDDSLIDGGGRLIVNGSEILFETDTATGRADSATFLGITAAGGSQSTISRYEIDSYSGLLNRIQSGSPLDQIITNDGPDADQFIDAGRGYDVTLALQNIFNLAPGEVGAYVTSTMFGTGAPAQILEPPSEPPPPPPPPPPFTFSGVVTNDLNANGQFDAGEPGIANAVVYLDLNNDNQLGLGEPAQFTNSRGEYGFEVREGTYILRQATMAGWAPTAPTAGLYTVTGTSGDVISNLFFGNSANTDFGDAPSPYPTSLSQGGPAHSILPGFSLGASVDGEGNGQPTSQADGDDLVTGDDDDGVVFVTPLVAGQTATLDVNVQAVGRATGLLHAWIDFNADGDWDDAGERVLTNRSTVAGNNRLTVAIPAGAKLGNTFARFRYGYGTAVGPTGPVIGGEVEDYRVSIVGTKPQANHDQYTIPHDTVNNVLAVLANDVASILGPISIVGTTSPSLGGRVVVNGDQTLSYTPKAGVLSGTETFSYTVTDFKGGFSTATVTITIGDPIVPPTAVDDVFRVNVNSVGNTLNVRTNDVTPDSPVTSVLVNQTTLKGGYVAVNAGSLTLRYTPPLNYIGIDQFEYTIRDARGLESKAIATVHVGMNTADDLATLELEITDPSGAPIDEVIVGGEFQLRISVTDERDAPTDPGVLAAYLDVLYSQNFVSPKPADNAYGFTLGFGAVFDQLRSGAAPVPGLLDEVGAARSSTPSDVGPRLLLVATFVADAVGQARFTADPTDVPINHDLRMGSPAFSVPLDKIAFGTATVNVIAAEPLRFQNSANSFDVNADRVVTALDALLIINELNSRGTASLRTRSLPQASPHYFDVSGDDTISPLDALLVINLLNSGGRGEDPGFASGAAPPESEEGDLFDTLAADVADAWN